MFYGQLDPKLDEQLVSLLVSARLNKKCQAQSDCTNVDGNDQGKEVVLSVDVRHEPWMLARTGENNWP